MLESQQQLATREKDDVIKQVVDKYDILSLKSFYLKSECV